MRLAMCTCQTAVCTHCGDCVQTRRETAAVSPVDDQLGFAPTESASLNPSTASQQQKSVQ